MYTQLSFMGHGAFWKENTEDSVKLLGSNVLNCCIEMTKPICVNTVAHWASKI